MNSKAGQYLHHNEEDDDEYEEEEEEHQENDAFTSIWDLVPGYTQSPLDGMLDKADTTLEDVLDEDTLIQELKSNNQKVVQFLARENHIDKMIDFLITEDYKETYKQPSNDKTEQDEIKRVFKYPFITCEIISCDVDDVVNGIINSKDRIYKLFSYFKNRNPELSPINPSHSQYFIKALSSLIQKHFKRIVAAIIEKQKEENIVQSLFVDHVGLCDMDNLVLKLMGFETHDDGFDQDAFGAFATQQRIRELFLAKQRGNDQELQQRKKDIRKTLLDNNFIPALIKKLEDDKNSEEVHRNIFNILSEVVQKGRNEIAASVLSKDNTSLILDVILRNSQTTVFIHGIPFLRIVIDHKEQHDESEDDEDENLEEADNISQITALIASRTKDFLSLLTTEPALEKVTTSHGTMDPPMGEMRLKVVEHLQTLFKISVERYAQIRKELVSQNVFNILLDLFFKYEFNNILHCQVFSIIQMVMESKDSELTKQLVVDAKLAERLIAAYKKNELVTSESAKAFRLGHMGFVVDIANVVRKYSLDSDSVVGKHIAEVPEWKDFVTNFLEPRNSTNEKQLGGPPPLGSTFQSYQFDDDDEDDDYHYDDDDDSDDDDEEVVVKKATDSDDSDDDEMDVRKKGAPVEDFEADFDNLDHSV
jgi:serine/threonine-protein phosphatase 6 regulatory subunit 3